VEILGLRPGSDFEARDVRIYRPYRDEIPWELLSAGDDPQPVLAEDALMRVAKYHDEVVGVYLIVPHQPLSFRLDILVVVEAFRRRGVGRWLLGHAIGLAESKGGRELVLDAARPSRFFLAAGFEPHGAGSKLTFTPE
jgi:GNAT superfamily N-acetyltransferase